MSLSRARIVKKAFDPARVATAATELDTAPALARRVPAVVLEAKAEATRILEAARREAAAIAREARDDAERTAAEAAATARERELARLAAEILVARTAEEQRRERELHRTVELAAILAERVVGEALAIEPTRIRHLAAEVLRETRGARKLRIEANASDLEPLRGLLDSLGLPMAELEANAELGPGSLVVQTELGRVDARLKPQLARLADALHEALRGEAVHAADKARP